MKSEVWTENSVGIGSSDLPERGRSIGRRSKSHGKRATEGVSFKNNGRLRSFIMACCLLVGVICILYPAVASYINELQYADVIKHYDREIQLVDEQTKQTMLAAAERYNESLAGDPVHDPFIVGSGYAVPDNYNDVLNVDGNGLIGYIKIPSLGLNLPIRHSTSDIVLSEGTGHIPQTSFPIGGEGTHSVITGHTGLPTARLFTDLIRMKEGDVFIIDVLGDKRAYAVDNIQVVEPDQVGSLHIEAGKEFVTLITCTPYGINSQRLLVRGVPTDMPEEGAITKPVPWAYLFLFLGLFAAGCVAWCVVSVRRSNAIEMRKGYLR